MFFRKSKLRLTPLTKTEVVKRLLDLAVVKVGNSERVVLVFFDLKCPFCAKLFKETEELLVDMANRGLITYAMCDYVVHRDAEPLHRMLRCISEKERLKFVRDAFEGKRVEIGNCPEGNLRICEKMAEELGVIGTPTLLFYHLAKGKGYIHFGYISPTEILEAISSL
ncbi:DsbA family protein [Pyrobaculum islandicum]|uniref:DsbA family protein n=1 Tax=Pyrobaculum islandicum TaxID=2277 RepID=UPI00069EB884|nr:thioredoxin fold domain-containing protein [Pyrobaculum islandicum]